MTIGKELEFGPFFGFQRVDSEALKGVCVSMAYGQTYLLATLKKEEGASAQEHSSTVMLLCLHDPVATQVS